MKLGRDLNCSEWQAQLSLYLYGELDFATEEALEEHLNGCPLCQLALAREKLWHTALNGAQRDVPGELLKSCREELQQAIPTEQQKSVPALHTRSWFWQAPEWLRVNFTPLSGRFALASLFVFLGIALGVFGGRLVHTGPENSNIEMSVFGSPTSRIRDIQPGPDGRVRIVVDRVEQQELVGTISDNNIRVLLLTAARQSADPGLRIDSVELLKEHHDQDIRDALLSAAQHDENAAVRLKAVDSLRAFPVDDAVRSGLIRILERDPDVSVRAEAIDALLPSNRELSTTPDLVRTLRGISRSAEEDDYIRMRCAQALRLAAVPESY
jgi:hypothetical protein